MKIVEQTPRKIVMRQREIFTRLWGSIMPAFSAVAFFVVMQNYTPALKPAVFICAVFFVVGIFVLLFVNKNLTYEFDTSINEAKIYYPARFATTFTIEAFPIDRLKFLATKWGISYGSGTENESRGPRSLKGFDFVLDDGTKIHSGIYSSSSKEIDKIIEQVTGFLGVKVVDSDQVDLLLN